MILLPVACALAVAALAGGWWVLVRPMRMWEVRAGGVRVRAGLTRARALGQAAELAVTLPGVVAVDRGAR